MTLVEIRRKFVELSGRYDLVSNTSTWVDAGANFFIQAGQQMLEQMFDTPAQQASIFLPLAINGYYLTFQFRCRSIFEVWANNGESRTQLTKVSLKDLKSYYPDLVSEIETGPPLYYAPASLRALETTSQDSLGIFLNYNFGESEVKYDYRGIIIGPPVDEAYVIEINGNFFQATLATDTQSNWWTIENPALLLKAALYQVETFYRNTEGARDWMNAIQLEGQEIEKDVVEEDLYDVDEMGD